MILKSPPDSMFNKMGNLSIAGICLNCRVYNPFLRNRIRSHINYKDSSESRSSQGTELTRVDKDTCIQLFLFWLKLLKIHSHSGFQAQNLVLHIQYAMHLSCYSEFCSKNGRMELGEALHRNHMGIEVMINLHNVSTNNVETIASQTEAKEAPIFKLKLIQPCLILPRLLISMIVGFHWADLPGTYDGGSRYTIEMQHELIGTTLVRMKRIIKAVFSTLTLDKYTSS
ncbi:hypothetical protein H5410_052764 [Solanum commersonii]|uniref:Uncharacterized protein n=1 Tax=Solanum commersonii TaxID=4109 RepID=A0A9J5X1Q9_SOLCO|nr:hypothetical protein H5410_052764 [Solanum commersonii]